MPTPFRIDVTDNASTGDTVNAIIDVINQQCKNGFIPEFSRALKAGTSNEYEYIKKLFDLICKYVEYERDPIGWERIYTPEKLFREAKGDCKKMTTAIAATLKAGGIEPLLKVISYDGNNWAHIYAIAKVNNKFYILDPVNFKKFNAEIPHKKAVVYNLNNTFKLMPTKLSILGRRNDMLNSFKDGLTELNSDFNLAGSTNTNSLYSREEIEKFLQEESRNIDGLSGVLDKLKQTVSNVVNKVGNSITNAVDTIKDGTAKVALAPARGAFLGLLLLGKALENTPIKLNLAQKMAAQWKTDNGAKLSKMWDSFGGNPSDLKEAIVKGSSQSLGYSFDPNTSTIHVDGMGAVTLAATAAAIAAATPIVIQVTKLLKDTGVIKEGSQDVKNLTATVLAAGAALNNKGQIPESMQQNLNKLSDDAKKAGGVVFSSPINTIVKSILIIILLSIFFCN